MKYYNYRLTLANINVDVSFRHPETSLYFHSFIKKSDNKDGLIIPFSDLTSWINNYGFIDNGNLEFGMSVYRISDALSHYKCSVIHGAAILFRNKAYLFAADSGVGKSTQIKNWMQLYSDEIDVMNGDKPILKLENNTIMVYPSPWKGKEEWGNDSLIAPLGGIILLKQGSINSIKRLKSIDSATRLLSYFFSTFENEEELDHHLEIVTMILKNVPVYRLINKGDLESSEITYKELMKVITKCTN